ncbi:PREDICTED: putative zinc finger protein At1g68190 [Camelina sativa]|uniref:Zinc finger protein At1g68190 n=1 Tax=Camelina sativa TaxID=90675 RepID=A0ABM0T0S2_CAMSA|nr:PREDICTED: putative zinc finger protein At1g68190 [Camelina sativa]
MANLPIGLCDSCKDQPCVVRCFDHRMFLCHGCNDKFHVGGGVSSEHHRRDDVAYYTGCPRTRYFAVVWGFRVMDDDDFSLEESLRMVKPKGRSEMNKISPCREASFVLEQILELEKLQLKEENNGLSLIERADPSPLELPMKSKERLKDLPQTGKELIVDFSHFSSSSTLGESFWEYKSPYNKNIQLCFLRLWHQNLQDIGVCEETVCEYDDFHLPDIDLTFRNFDEEQFGAHPEPIADSNNMFFVSSLDKSSKMKTYSGLFNFLEQKELSTDAARASCLELDYCRSSTLLDELVIHQRLPIV